MKKRTIGMIIGVSAISGGIMLGGRVLPTPAHSASGLVSLVACGTTAITFGVAELSTGRHRIDTDEQILSQLKSEGNLTDSQARVVLAFEQKILAVSIEQKQKNADKVQLQRHIDQLQADLLAFIKNEKLPVA